MPDAYIVSLRERVGVVKPIYVLGCMVFAVTMRTLVLIDDISFFRLGVGGPWSCSY